MRDVYILSSIGLLILLLACINFINLSNVHSLKRAKEIGVRKVLGAQKSSLMIQFLSESSALVLVSFMIAFTLLATILPVINEITTKHFIIEDLFSTNLMIGLYILFVTTAFLAGLYPSFYVTRFRPAVVLKGITRSPIHGRLSTTQDFNCISIYRVSYLGCDGNHFLSANGFCQAQALGLPTRSYAHNSTIQ